jgi:ubiquinone/menaquinone biosynthesis C-methylase UbiE
MASGERMEKDVLEANIEVHTRMVERYEAEEPHFRPENQEKVRGRLRALRERVPGGRLLDVGCGTGFIIHLAIGVFDEIHGLDITPAMLRRVRTTAGNIALHRARAEAMPFVDESFDAATAYSFVDHVSDQGALLREVARVLKPGGIFYADLVPNRLFWRALASIGAEERRRCSDIVAREAEMVTANDRKVEQQFGIPAATFRMAEPGKEDGGIDPAAFRSLAMRSGFAACEVSFDWFLGQGAVMHRQSFADAAVVEAYLRRVAPLADHLFKYVYFHAVK